MKLVIDQLNKNAILAECNIPTLSYRNKHLYLWHKLTS